MSFLKAKDAQGNNVLFAVDSIVAVTATAEGTIVSLKTGAKVETTLGFQSVSNRLKDLGAEVV